MRHSYGQAGIPDSLPFYEPQRLYPESHVKHPVCLAVETVVVTVAVLAGMRALNIQGADNFRWFMIPALLALASLVPTWIGGRAFPLFGLDFEHIGLALGAVCRTFVYVVPLIFLALWLMKRINMPIPLRPVIGAQHDWLSWLLHQFLYVAVGEEMFFRGYVQANAARVLNCGRWQSTRTDEGIAILVSASCFALAHVLVQGQITSAVAFLPGVLLAWLFLRTHSLLAPILFHGLANVTYAIAAMTLS
ncbi:MAG: CPBP family intramembrane metalloprotease [Sedimentisphaerales bacterium]|nr:CPBP family intramembrane metalloprotease [Sedimentisphaerales bacterium]